MLNGLAIRMEWRGARRRARMVPAQAVWSVGSLVVIEWQIETLARVIHARSAYLRCRLNLSKRTF